MIASETQSRVPGGGGGWWADGFHAPAQRRGRVAGRAYSSGSGSSSGGVS
jgi:hypothetical protein